MTIDDAIAILEQEERLAKLYNEHLGKPALKLGTEALKRIKTLRTDWRISAAAPLPDETEDYEGR